MPSYLDSFAVTEQLYGREVKIDANRYTIQFTDLRKQRINSLVTFFTHTLILSCDEFNNSKLKHIIENSLTDFSFKLKVERKKSNFKTQTGREITKEYDLLVMFFNIRDEGQAVVGCWNCLYELLLEEDYLEKSIARLENTLMELKIQGANW